MNEWINVKDRLPELKATPFIGRYESDYVLVAHSGNDSETIAPSPWIGFMHIYGKMKEPEWGFIEDKGFGPVTHWMSLPEPPESDNLCDFEGNPILCKCGKAAGYFITGHEAYLAFCAHCSPFVKFSANRSEPL